MGGDHEFTPWEMVMLSVRQQDRAVALHKTQGEVQLIQHNLSPSGQPETDSWKPFKQVRKAALLTYCCSLSHTQSTPPNILPWAMGVLI